ncbi:hypothetical protein [Kordiimonas aestuarii]|uniref:hypothetical protein n=1 Tax=Kordiimonas aestuarii TaxID=1005925 RepID=UPI0021CF4359|nr:hypothetical protein [Kordiimonas aestuarii]
MLSLKTPTIALALLALTPVTHADDHAREVGKSLNHKMEVPIAEVPAAVLAAATAKRPALKFTEAEKEMRGGRQYFDLEGHDDTGNEIELDMMLDDDGQWQVVEIQRDVLWEIVPALVQEELLGHVPGVKPARIIESDQDNGTIIYEFYTRDANGIEAKYEVSLTGEEATFLKEEWQH